MYLKGKVGANKSGRTTINIGCQFSFNTSQNLRAATGVHVWRSVAGATATTTSFSVGLDYLLARVWTI